MSTSCSSTSVESTHSASITVRSVFSCVASRKREAAGPRDEASRSPSGPNPLGENITLSSPPLEPRGLLLSVMRQKVGKERSQGVFAPLANPRRNCPNLAKPSCGPTPAGNATSADELRAPPGVAVARATRRVAVVQLIDRLQTLLGENSALPTPLRLCKTPVGVPSGTAEAGDSASRYFPAPSSAKISPWRAGRPAELCKEKPSLRVPSGTGASRGAAAGPSDPTGRNCST